MTSKNNKAPLLYYIKLCASFQIHLWIQTGVTVQKCSIRVKIGNFLSRMNLKFDGWPWKTRGHLFYTTLSFVQHFKAIGTFKLDMLNLVQNWQFFVPGDFENGRMTLKNDRAPLLYYVKLCALFRIHWWSQTWVTAWKRSSRVRFGDFFVPHDLENWCMTFKNKRAPLLCSFKLYASFHHHMWIQTGVTVRKQLTGVMTSVTLTFDLWPWPLAWVSCLSMVITPENFKIIRWQEHCQKGVTDGQTDGNKCSWSCLVAAKNLIVLMNNFQVITVPADGLAPLGARASAGTMMTKFVSSCMQNLMQISLKFVSKGYMSALVQIMARCWTGDKPLSEPMMTKCTGV